MRYAHQWEGTDAANRIQPDMSICAKLCPTASCIATGRTGTIGLFSFGPRSRAGPLRRRSEAAHTDPNYGNPVNKTEISLARNSFTVAILGFVSRCVQPQPAFSQDT
jgi:hypothetical protein